MTKDDLKVELEYQRPSLRETAPLTFVISVCYSIFNLLVGTWLFLGNIRLPLYLVGLIDIKIWGLIFFLHGLFLILFLFRNKWNQARLTMFIGLFIKGAWLVDLTYSFFRGGSLLVVLVWALLMSLQFFTWYYFTPEEDKCHAAKA